MRKPFEGVLNIIKFNWDFFLIAAVLLSILIALSFFLSPQIKPILLILSLLLVLSILLSLLVSYYVYDRSNLYNLGWLNAYPGYTKILNVNAGFDEISKLIRAQAPNCNLTVIDFYNPSRHTEKSIERARKTYPKYNGTINVSTDKIALESNSFDLIICFLSAHEIRKDEERIKFFTELKSVLTSNGEIIVVEHLRDFANFCAYNIGYLHFFSKSKWKNTFANADLELLEEKKITPFISKFKLSNGTSS